VYGAPPHTGRGGWTWYTGSAGWLYRVAVEAILGFQRRGDTLHFSPCIPKTWPQFELSYRYGSATYRIVVDNSSGTGRGVQSVELDGQRVPDDVLTLSDDAKTHHAVVRLG
jgi:cellobiose phosphorylase